MQFSKVSKQFISFILVLLITLSTIPAYAGQTYYAGQTLTTVNESGREALLSMNGSVDYDNFAPTMVTWTNPDGILYHAYCVNPAYPGYGDANSYTVDLQEFDNTSVVDAGGSGGSGKTIDSNSTAGNPISNALRGAVAYGFPSKSAAEILKGDASVYGVTQEQLDYAAYLATKMAIWALIHNNYGIGSWAVNNNPSSKGYPMPLKQATLAATKEIFNGASSYTPPNGIDITLTAGVPVKNEVKSVYEVTYTIGGSAIIPNTEMYVRVDENFSPFGNLKVLNASTGEEYSMGDPAYPHYILPAGTTEFKAAVPIPSGDTYSETYKLMLFAQTDVKTLVYGKSNAPNTQNYVLAGSGYGNPSDGFTISDEDSEEIPDTKPTDPPSTNPPPTNPPSNSSSGSIVKLDAKDGSPIPNVTFDLYFNGQLIESGTTDSSGGWTPKNITEPGDYTVIERVTNPDYQYTEPTAQVFTVPESMKYSVVFRDFKKQDVVMYKEDSVTGKPVEGCEYEIIQIDGRGAWRAVGRTDGRGQIIWEDVPDGAYMVREVSTVSGYILDQTPQYVTVRNGMTPSLKFLDSKFPGLTITKQDEKTGETIMAPATFHVEQVDGEYEADVTTKDGRINLTDLPVGTYEITETVPPKGYVLNPTPKSVSLAKNASVQVIMENPPTPTLIIEKVDGQTGKPIAGVKYEIKKDTTLIGTVTTGENGQVTVGMDGTDIGYLQPGTYQVTEVFVPEPWVLPTDGSQHQDITLAGGDTKTLTFTNLEMPTITVSKYDEQTGEKLSGAQFAVYEQEDMARPVAEGMTDDNGEFSSDRIMPGTYVIKELNPPPGYMYSDKTDSERVIVAKTGDGIIQVKIDNVKLPELIIKKVDAITGEPIVGVTYSVVETDDTSAQPATATTDADGIIRIPGLKTGTYTVTEISAPSRYILNPEPQQVQLNGGDTKTLLFENTLYPTLVIQKRDYTTNKPVPDTTFLVERENSDGTKTTVGTYRTDADGRIVLPYVPVGWYIFTETIPAQGMQTPANPVTRLFLAAGTNSYTDHSEGNTGGNGSYTVASGLDYPVIGDVVNYPLNSIVIKKSDANTGEMLDGATFEVIRVTGETSGQNGTLICTATTDVSGVIVITGLEAGGYTVHEIKAPDNYLISETDSQSVNLKADGTSIVEVLFNNYPYGAISIDKTDGATGLPLQGASFKVTDAAGSVLGDNSYTTDAQGNILIPNVKPGSYVITELTAPEGYAANTTPQTVLVGTDGKTYKVSFTNYPLGTLLIKKYDQKSKEPLADAKFKVTDTSGAVIGEGGGIYTTDEKGTIIIPSLPKGAYTVEEIQAPSGYILENQAETVVIDYSKTYSLEFYNKKMSGLQIIKIDAETKQPLKGAEFTVYKQNGEVIGKYTTNGEGIIILDKLVPGWYKISEAKAPSGYQIDDTPQDVEITDNQFIKITFENKKLTSLIIKKIDGISGAPLTGAKFAVEKQNGGHIGEFTTDSDGAINIPTLDPDWYVVREKFAPAGYQLDETPKTVEVKTQVPTVVTFENKPLSGIEIIKLDAVNNSPLSGVAFVVERDNGEKIGVYKTDLAGKIIVPDLSEGTYIVSETVAPDGYTRDEVPKTVTVKSGRLTTVEFRNKPLSGIEIIKIDLFSKDPLTGATFTAERPNGEKIGTFKTDQAGKIIIPDLSEGAYIISETIAPEGYILSETPKTVEVVTGKLTTVEFTNKPLSGIEIIKLDSSDNSPLSGASFLVERDTGERIGTYKTDSTGKIIVPDLEEGTYIVSETAAPEGFILDEAPKTVIVESGKLTTTEFFNAPFAGLKIIKLNSKTRRPIEGVEFSVTKMSGEKIENDFRGYNFKTDSTGQIYIPNLENGYYTVTETRQAEGYIIDGEPKTVLVESGKPTILEVLNDPMSGLLIVKTDAQTGKPLKGVMFDVRRADGSYVSGDILDENQPGTYANSPNKTTVYNGDLAGSYTTDANGRILINSLDAGRYLVTERKQLPGYELDTDVHDVTVTQGKLFTLQLQNKPLAGLRIKKVDSITGAPIFNTEFMVFDHNNKVVGTFYSDNNGVVDFSAVLTEGRYTIRETCASEGYYLDEIPKTVEFVAGKVTEIVWKNTPCMGQIQITKRSADDNEVTGLPAGTPLAGAIFEVYAYKSGNLVDRFVTESNGKGVSKPLPLGRYTVKEVQAPPYYQLNNEELDITVEFATQIINLEYTNRSANTGVTIKKTGNIEAMPGDLIRYDIKEVSNDSSIPLTDFFWRDVLPTDAVRLNKIITGSYNQSLRYKIMITTNKGDTRVIADNLSTTQNNVIDCSNASLGLYNDEFVTSFTLVFGNVKAGFTCVEQPQVYVTVNQNLPNGYEFANKADVGGKTGQEWVIGNAVWKCTLYRPANSRMPKTGW